MDGDSGMKESEEMHLKSTINESTLSTADAVPLPREGARVDTPSFLWKEVPRRGGGWMGISLSPTQSLPRVGKVASGASRIGF